MGEELNEVVGWLWCRDGHINVCMCMHTIRDILRTSQLVLNTFHSDNTTVTARVTARVTAPLFTYLLEVT